MIQALDAADKCSVVREIHIVQTMTDAGLGNRVALALEWSGNVNERVVLTGTENLIEVPTPIQR